MADEENTQVQFTNEGDALEYLLPINTVEELDNAMLINRILTKALRVQQFQPSEQYPIQVGMPPQMLVHHSIKDDGADDKAIRSIYNDHSWISCADLREDKDDHDIGYNAVKSLREFNKGVKPENLIEYTNGWVSGQEFLKTFDSKNPKVSISMDSINKSKERDCAACIYYDLPDSIRMDVKELTKEDKRVLYFVYADHQFLLTAVIHRGL